MTKQALIERMREWEDGDMSVEKMVGFFQELIASGLAWRLTNPYSEHASYLIRHGYCQLRQGVE